MLRVLLVNNYSMENTFALWQKGTSGSHHVWGKVELDKKERVKLIIFKHEKYKFINKIGNALNVGHLDQQVRILNAGKTYDILYSPYSSANTRFLLFLKILGLYRKPIVVTIHQPFLGTKSKNRYYKWFTKKLLLQYDASIFLSEELLKTTVRELDIPKEVVDNKFHTAQWGPDVNFYSKFKKEEKNGGQYYISAGHTARDYETLIEAFRILKLPLRIFCTVNSTPNVEDVPDNVTINSSVIPYFDLLKYYYESKAILIPLKYPSSKEGCQGMTSLQDVVALGKPTIITHNPSLNLDVEKEGFGINVNRGDVKGWIDAVNVLESDKARVELMSENARRVYREKFNSEIFANTLENVILKVGKKFNLTSESV